ncbi:hypothetical protein F5Y13DRAFT_204140 [Hypoxylon sp. FL1857]|nr:hypothetical protein F5Y13DRAFT_204140 [Hypoxylon sp. FL1857]
MTEAQREADAGAAEDCSWRGDSPEPELDDLAYDHETHGLPGEVCSWHGDSPEPELDDLAHDIEDKQSPKLSPKSRATSDTGPHRVQITPRPLGSPPKPEIPNLKNRKKTSKKSPREKDSGYRDQNQDVSSGEKPRKNPQDDNQPPPGEEKGEQRPGNTEESLQEKVSQGIHQAFSVIQNAMKSSNPQPDFDQLRNLGSGEDRKQSTKENDIPPEPVGLPHIPTIVEPRVARKTKAKEDKEKAKREKEEAKKAEKEKKAKEKEDKKRLKKEKEEAKKEQRRKSKEKKGKGKETASPPPELPAGANIGAASESHAHPGCRICQNPEDEGTRNFMKELLESAQDLPSFNDLANAARKFIGMKDTAEGQSTEQSQQSHVWDEDELIEHIAAHIDKHIHQHFDLDSLRGEFPAAGKALPHKADSKSTQEKGSAIPRKQAESRDNNGPTSHGLDGNGDWPVTNLRGHILRSLEPTSTPEVALTQPPSRAYSPCRAPTSRSVSPWCEQLGFKIDNPVPSFPKRHSLWSRRG